MLRLLHGFSTGFKPTATSAYLADIVPSHRRGEALGILGVAFNLGASASPPFGSWIAGAYGINAMFYASGSVALLSLLALWGLQETLPQASMQAFRPSLLKVHWRDVWYKPSLLPAFVLLLVYSGYGLLLTVSPDHSDLLGLPNRGLYFLFFTGASLLSRLLAGSVSDRFGRVPIISLACALNSVGLLFMGFVPGALGLLGGAAMFGFTTGVAGPALMAWVIDRAEDKERGRAFATLYIFLEASIGLGALLSAWLFANQASRLPLTYATFALISLSSLLVLWRWGNSGPQEVLATA